ncbi:MAG: hypothetical protein ACYCT0_02300 [Sulfobacillus sp.]
MKEFTNLWRKSAAVSLGLAALLAVAGLVTGSNAIWGLALGIIPGVMDLVGLGLRLPLWARLNQRAAVASVNLRLLSRLVVLAVYFYVLHRYTQVNLKWAVVAVFFPHAIYGLWAFIQHRSRGVKG